jgi:hypothetical protein
MEELTSRGIETRTGVPKDCLSLFGIKELIDNAVDNHEMYHPNLNNNNNNNNDSKPRVRIQVINEPSLTRILIRNSDPYHHEHEIFTKQKIEHMFDLDRIYSSKRYQFRISRGALGDALKEVLRIPYILATEGYQYPDKITYWKEPLIIRITHRTFRVTLHVDRIEQSRRSYVEEYQVQNKCNNSENFSEIEFSIPANSLDLAELKRFLRDYMTAIPHIDFTFIDEKNKVTRFQQVQPIKRDWTSMCSIYYYTYHEFSEFVHGLEEDSSIVHSVLRSVFREGSNMRKTELTSISIGTLKRSPGLIPQVFEQLRDIKLNHIGPISDPSDLSLPINTN